MNQLRDQLGTPSKHSEPVQDKKKQPKSRNPFKAAQDSIEGFFQERDNEGEVVQQSPRWMRATTWGLIGTAAFAVGWLGFAKTDEVVK